MPIFDLEAYSRDLQSYTPHPLHTERQKLLHRVIQKELKRIFSIDHVETANPAVFSIIDHHDVLNHSSFIFPNVVANMYRFQKKGGIITITDSGVPVDHFGNRRGMNYKENILKLFSHSKRHTVIFGAPPLAYTTLCRQDKGLNFDIDAVFKATAATVSTYSDQISLINKLLWRKIFPAPDAPELFHISGENIAMTLLETYIQDRDSVFYKILFDAPTRTACIATFNTIKGCWNNDTTYGTHLFWGINSKGGAERLWLENNALVNSKKTIAIELTPENIRAQLKARAIFPGLFLVYGILIFYCGIKPLTGTRSNEYILKMKEKWMEFSTEKELISAIPTDNMVQNKFKNLFTLNIIERGGLDMHYIKKVEKMRLASELLSAILSSFRRIRHRYQLLPQLLSGE